MTAAARPEPPIIRTAVPWAIRARDWLLTLATWGVALVLLRDFVEVAHDWLTPPRFQLTATAPTWDAVLGIYLRHEVPITVILLWFLSWGLVFSFRQRSIRAHRVSVTPVSTGELAQASGLPEERLREIRAGRIIDVRSGKGGSILEATPRPVEVEA